MDKEILGKLHSEEIEILDEIDRVCKKNKIQYFLIGGTLLGAVRHKGFIPWDDDLDIVMPRKDYNKFIRVAKQELNEKFIIDSIETNENYWLPFMKVRLKDTIFAEKSLRKYTGNKGIFVDIFPLDNEEKEGSYIQTIKYKGILICRYIIYKKMNIEEDINIFKKILNQFFKCIPNKMLKKIMVQLMSSNSNEKAAYYTNYGSQYGVKKQTHLKEWYMPNTYIEFEGKEYPAPNQYKKILKKIYGDNYMQLPPISKRITHKPDMIKFEDGTEYKF